MAELSRFCGTITDIDLTHPEINVTAINLNDKRKIIRFTNVYDERQSSEKKQKELILLSAKE